MDDDNFDSSSEEEIEVQNSGWNYLNGDEQMLRQKVKKYLNTFILSSKNVETVESLLYLLSKKGGSLQSTCLNRTEYMNNVLEFHSLMYKHEPQEIMTRIKNGETGYVSHEFNVFIDIEKQEISKLNSKIEAVSGIYTCSKCKGSKTTQFALQLRRSDEPPTVFIFCANTACKHKWREN